MVYLERNCGVKSREGEIEGVSIRGGWPEPSRGGERVREGVAVMEERGGCGGYMISHCFPLCFASVTIRTEEKDEVRWSMVW